MSKKLYRVYLLKRYKDGYKYVVYKWEFGKVLTTYYKNKKVAEANKNYISI